jgi:DNA-binding NarL/FixJ family response regulator
MTQLSTPRGRHAAGAPARTWPDVDILIVDDHQIFAEALAMRLEAEEHVGDVRVASNLAVARTLLRGLVGGLVLLDYELGDECGLDLMDDIGRLEVRPAVVVVSGNPEPDAIVTGLRHGIDAWMLKSDGYQALAEVCVDACQRIMTLPKRSLREVVDRLLALGRGSTAPPSFLQDLTRRELEVLELLVAGVSRDEIATQLFVSPHTVRTHVQHLHERAGVHSTVALVARAREAGLGS